MVDIIKSDNSLELAKEIEVTVYINGLPSHLMCSPNNLEELAIGFVVSEGLIDRDLVDEIEIHRKGNEIFVDVDANSFTLELRSSGCVGVFKKGEVLPPVEAKEKFSLDELKKALEYIDVEEYRKTRGYHSSAIVGKKGLIVRAIDVGRHNAVDKAIGMALRKNIDTSKVFLLISGRISRGIAAKAVRSGIPLVVSKASILDSAIDVCKKTGLSAVSFASDLIVKGDAIDLG
ncbi:formate dehydrogenase family accessory protein FdhD [Archaeoglobus sulfaticallidus PM70-1]|uniref:Formate dehydrogenase family accessory protein FdhD n=1 Tax=Archaeoglobus sulfaticallidus PM70-1 TaxID=387631 RepID=N0BLN3_9EURY|nr:formate dehydrogenase accessory sulfurtransferase FdhD [Archaeoglobus sulfaticallidus]AGK61135.1 formate dehydrogenase family accessory protein FdhD [Archaeoglobus sulfaticallidus PM70-1]